MATQTREAAVNAADSLNELIGDLVTGSMLLREWDVSFRAGRTTLLLFTGIQKMCLSHIVLALHKFIEFYERYHNALSAEHRATAKALIREIKRRGVIEIRNKFVGHMWDNILGRPLMHSEIMSRLTGMAEGDLLGFVEWINNPKASQTHLKF